MCTYLETAGKINADDLDIKIINQSEIIFLEGYLWDEGDPKKAFDKAINNSKKLLCLCLINFVLIDINLTF